MVCRHSVFRDVSYFGSVPIKLDSAKTFSRFKPSVNTGMMSYFINAPFQCPSLLQFPALSHLCKSSNFQHFLDSLFSTTNDRTPSTSILQSVTLLLSILFQIQIHNQDNNTFFYSCRFQWVGRDSSVGKATRYGLDGPGIEYR